MAATFSTIATAAGASAALPWQTVYGSERPDISAFLSAAALPAARQAVRASLKRPGIAMAVTASLDLIVAGVSGGTGALLASVPRFLLGGATSVLSMMTGSKTGPMRQLTGVVSLVTMAVQLGFTGWTVIGGVVNGTPVLTLLPMVVAMLSALAMAAQTTYFALVRR